MTRLSACLIVRDELASLGACLDSISALADEIVIVDTGSTDGTLAVVEQRATRFARVTWSDDFSAARNASLDLARGEWVLVIDADEQLVDDHAQVRQAIANPGALAYQLEVRNDLGNGAIGSAFITRLFRRLPELRYAGRVHEQLGAGIAALMSADPSWQVGRISGAALAHTGYLPAVVTARGKGARNARLLELELDQTPDDYYLHYKLYQARGGGTAHHALLVRAAQLLLDLPAPALRTAGIADEILTAAALAWLDRGELDHAERASRTALVLGRHPATLVVLGRALLATGKAREARDLLGEALARPPAAHDFHVDPVALERIARGALIDAHLAAGDATLAAELARTTCERFPDQAALVHQLVRALLAAGEAGAALQEGFAWFEHQPDDAACLGLCADAAELLGHASDAAEWRAMAARLRP